jgi:hypothetical protein
MNLTTPNAELTLGQMVARTESQLAVQAKYQVIDIQIEKTRSRLHLHKMLAATYGADFMFRHVPLYHVDIRA